MSYCADETAAKKPILIMNNFLKLLLFVCVVSFLASLTDVGSNLAWGALKPLSAILFIVFFIGQLLQKPVAQFDEEARLRSNSASKPAATREPRVMAKASPSPSRSLVSVSH